MEDGMAHEASPAARALLALEAIGNNPGITAQRLGDRLGVTERAARRYVAVLREAELPIESLSGPHGGYRVGRGLRLPPLTFTPAEAMGLVMAVLEGHRSAADPADLVGGALAKILRVLPERVADPVKAVRSQAAEAPVPALVVADPPPVSPELTTRLIEYCTAARRLRLTYRTAAGDREMEVDPWAVVLRHSLWYLLCWSRTRQARRVLRVDRIVSAFPLTATFTPPPDLDALRTLEDHLSQDWDYDVDVVIDASTGQTARWLPRSLGLLEDDGAGRTRLRASTSSPDWYARQLATLPAPFRVLRSPELRKSVTALAHQLLAAVDPPQDA
ncbi:MAG: WYL domain-containing protein [Nocardiopsaceae bacterium]|nr:WYL domain-containing protein [Nocardiopsaceae bacterium]